MIKAERTKRRIKASNPERKESPDCEGSGLFRSTSIAAALRRVEEGGVATVDHKGEEEEAKDSAQDPGQETLSRWLASNPGIEVISRDRSETYATGARQGAPDATQVADRWHLLSNWREAVERVFDRHRGRIKGVVLPPPRKTRARNNGAMRATVRNVGCCRAERGKCTLFAGRVLG